MRAHLPCYDTVYCDIVGRFGGLDRIILVDILPEVCEYAYSLHIQPTFRKVEMMYSAHPGGPAVLQYTVPRANVASQDLRSAIPPFLSRRIAVTSGACAARRARARYVARRYYY
eukprot:COSAG02_NODE_261_length_26663_cov_210.330899_6_plen_114_part_00